ncbi:MAG: L-fuculose-phosphate aldolase [Solirubrobacteraceae bacterium]|nr:L-fuculose-phosphate aldolase [Solirubrobacteraceae bacterium]
MRMREHRVAVAAASHRLAAAGLVHGTAGNVSVADGGEVAITPTGARLGGLSSEQVAVVGVDGTQLDGELAPTSELDLHLAVHRARGDGAVVHTHAPVATAMSCVLDELPCVHYEMLRLGGTVRVAPYSTFGTPELATGAAAAIEGRAAALLANHGTLVHADDVETALELTHLLEWACTVYWRAASVGTPRVLDQAEREAVVAAVVARGYGSTKARPE